MKNFIRVYMMLSNRIGPDATNVHRGGGGGSSLLHMIPFVFYLPLIYVWFIVEH